MADATNTDVVKFDFAMPLQDLLVAVLNAWVVGRQTSTPENREFWDAEGRRVWKLTGSWVLDRLEEAQQAQKKG